MTLKEAKKLNIGDRVRWPEGANGCKETLGTVHAEGPAHDPTRFVKWDDDTQGERTYLHDEAAIEYLVRA